VGHRQRNICLVQGWGTGRTLRPYFARRNLERRQNNYELPYSQIKKLELKKFSLGVLIRIVIDEKQHKWAARGIPGKKNWKIEDFEKVLRPIFSDRLSVSD
jgi:hypothetical protein